MRREELMEKWIKRVISLGSGLFLTGKINPSVVPYYPQKTEISGDEEKYFPRVHPERVGVSSGRLLSMIRALERERRANVHSLMVIKDGAVILECAHPGYDVNTWHLSHSMSKTLTGMAIGVLVDEGRLSLDELLVDIFEGAHYKDPRFAKISVYHLLTMSAGVHFSEAGSISESRWSEAFFEAPLSYTPGSSFSYNSMNTYILAKIVTLRSGESLTDFVRRKILLPLGIDNFFWELGPEGVEKGGWGVYMSAESWAKLGVMMLSGGVFEGKRILSEEWVREASRQHMVTPDTIGNYNYGYQMWSSRDSDNYLFNGMLGQNVWICPKNNIVVSLNSGNNELFQDSPAMAVIEKYLAPDLSDDLHDSCHAGSYSELREAEEHFFERRHWVRPYEPRAGIRFALGFGNRTPYPEEWDELIGKYNFVKSNFGMLPLIVRTMQNNMKTSLDGIEFDRDGEDIFFTFTESGESYRIAVGFYDFKTTVIDYHGERYIVKAIGEAMENEDREMIYKLELLFPELPNTRMIKLSFREDGSLFMRMSELPNQKIADVYIEEMALTNPAVSLVLGIFEKRIGDNVVKKKLRDAFNPSFVGARVGSENYVAIMDGEREKLKSSMKNAGIIDAVVKKLFHDAEAEERGAEVEDLERSGFRAFLGDVVDRIRQRFPQKKRGTAGESDALPSGDAAQVPELPTGEEKEAGAPTPDKI